MSQIEGPRNPRFIIALTVDQVDWSLFRDPHFARERLERYFPSQGDFYRESAYSIRLAYGDEHSGYPVIRKSEELKNFLGEKRPQALFFLPNDIKNLLTPDSDIICNHQKTENLETWEFSLNPQKHEISPDSFSPNRKQTITLKRGESVADPYLVVGFPARYDGSDVVFSPDIKITSGDIIPRDKLEEEMIKLLGLEEHRVKQNLVFQAKKEEAQRTTTDSLGRVIETQKWDVYSVEISLK